MQSKPRREHRVRKSVMTLLSGIAALTLCAFQFGDRNELNKMPFDQVQALVSNLAKARRLAKQGNVDLLVGQIESGWTVTMRGEVTDANCYLGTHAHAYDHAFCAKLCAAAGGPLVFIPDQGQGIYLVLNEQNGVRLPKSVLDHIGVPGILVKGKVVDADGIRALAVAGLAP
jgi:hypothetical protein